jgi:predicted dinucleotide-binding enzyme
MKPHRMVVYVTDPHWMDAHSRSEQGALLDSYHAVSPTLDGDLLAKAFLKQGHETSIWNRTKSKCEPLAALGAQVTPSVQEAVAAAEIIVVNVNDYVTSDALLREDDVTKALHGKLLVQLTSGTPKHAKKWPLGLGKTASTI